ncbi:IS607 family transposase [Scytonema hofmannii]|uniref:IS607 family transposase n=1 Tax=Scytonema hofmannii TaxID=34078 RepID=UPI00234F09AE|nr:IS607 family transposase [Scytonema hofmannii]
MRIARDVASNGFMEQVGISVNFKISNTISEFMPYISPKDAAELTGFHPKTLAKWADAGKIDFIKAESGYRRYDVTSLRKMIGEDDRAVIIYGRVSTHSQKDDLQRQLDFLRSRYPKGEMIYEVGSGLNFKRKKLLSILERVINREVKEIVVAYSDRLVRFGFDLVVWLCAQFDCKVIVLNQVVLSPQQELVQDLLAIMHCFSARLYGLRKYEKPIRKTLEVEKLDEDSMKNDV